MSGDAAGCRGRSGDGNPRPTRAFIYTIDELKCRRHRGELATPALFQYYVALQSHRRSLHRQAKAPSVQVDMHALQHRLSAICLQLTRVSFNRVFQEILALGIASDRFVLSFVNVVFKQAVLNPPLSLLFAMLASSVHAVLKETSHAEQMRRLFFERCDDSLQQIVRDDDEMAALLRGVVSFAGHLLRQAMVAPELFEQWGDRLLQNDSSFAIELLTGLSVSCGAQFLTRFPAVIRRLAARLRGDAALADALQAFQEIGSLPPEIELSRMTESPSVDRDLNSKYPALFHRSGSIPLELARFGDDPQEKSISTIVTQYFYNPDIQDFIAELTNLNYFQNDPQTAIDLLRAVVEKPTQNQIIVAPLVFDVLRNGFYDRHHLLAAVCVVASEAPTHVSRGRKLVRIYAEMLNQEIATFNDFEKLFGAMRGIWSSILQQFFMRLDQLRGDWIYDLLESDFWRRARFLGVDSIFDKMNKLKEWDLMSYLPQYEVVALFAETATAGAPNPDLLSTDELTVGADIDADIVPLVFEVLTELGDELMVPAARAVRRWLAKATDLIPKLAKEFGERGVRVAAALQ